MIPELVLGFWLALFSGWTYAKLGGDSKLEKKRPHLKKLLKVVHHWHIGIALALVSILMLEFYLIYEPFNFLLFGFGNGLVIEDYFYHQSHDW
jgi:hypothetical protein